MFGNSRFYNSCLNSYYGTEFYNPYYGTEPCGSFRIRELLSYQYITEEELEELDRYFKEEDDD